VTYNSYEFTKGGTLDFTVFIASQDATCSECGENLGRHAWITLTEDKEVLCLSCADLDHLVFLPSGDAALTRRSGKYSTLKAIVLKWSSRRKRYERQGILAEESAVQKAEEECLADADARERQREREAQRREEQDQVYLQQFAARVRQLYPNSPQGVEDQIAQHACEKYSGRVGRTASAKNLDEEAVSLAVIAYIRHALTEYDKLLAQGVTRFDARQTVRCEIEDILYQWRGKA
jgi:hypothetical protein